MLKEIPPLLTQIGFYVVPMKMRLLLILSITVTPKVFETVSDSRYIKLGEVVTITQRLEEERDKKLTK